MFAGGEEDGLYLGTEEINVLLAGISMYVSITNSVNWGILKGGNAVDE
jgi:hypothetical protein